MLKSMVLSERLKATAGFISECSCLADVGTDHAYVPINAVLSGLCSRAIATDINKGPIAVAQRSIKKYNLQNKIQTRVGPGLSVLYKGEADIIIIAGMGGHMICDIINNDMEIAGDTKYLVLQPIQHVEVLRKFLCSNGFLILDEELCREDNKYYHVIKASKGHSEIYEKDIYYYLGKRLIEKRHPLLGEYIDFNLRLLNDILQNLSPEKGGERYEEILTLINGYKDVKKDPYRVS
jgi:tRNA (adenine22-N1)-methyltransferase